MNETPSEYREQSSDKETKEGPVIRIEGLGKAFGGQQVLANIAFDLNARENLVVLGKSGSGKSVLIKCIVRLHDADNGTIEVLGQNVMDLKKNELGELRQQVGFLFQSGALYDSMTVRQNLEFPLRRIRKGLSPKEIDEKVMEVLEGVGLADAIDKMPAELSGGMRKRVSLARTLVADPVIMLYDEPTTGLDPVTSNEISELINEVQKKYKTSSIIITHDIECARMTANRLMMLQDGNIYKSGTLDEFENSDDPLLQSFFRKSEKHS